MSQPLPLPQNVPVKLMSDDEPKGKRNRRAARALVLQILFEIDVARHSPGETLYAHLSEQEFSEQLELFIRDLVTGTLAHLDALDSELATAASEWPLSQMAAVDRNILRMGLYEIRHNPDTPVEVVINEAVELGRRFGSDSSARFVNGVLGTLAGRGKGQMAIGE